MFARTLILSAAVCLSLVSAAAVAADPATSKQLTPQQQRMGDCNKQAKGKTGDERKAFMKTCLSADGATAGRTTQQQKMTTCNADAKTKALKGEERKTYMKTCLSGDAAAAQ